MTKSKPPKSLSAEAKKWWKQITDAFEIDDSAGLLTLQIALESFDQMRLAERTLSADGLTIKDRFGQVRQHPASMIQRDSRTALMRALKQLNLDIEPPGAIGRPPGR